jgi:site-specific recombinase XerD
LHLLETHFGAPKTLRRLRAGLSAAYIDGFADELDADGYAHASVVRYVRAAAHLGVFVKRNGRTLADIDDSVLRAFVGHLPQCRCRDSNGGKTGYHARFGVKLFYLYLKRRGVCSNSSEPSHVTEPALITAFREWFRTHRGVQPPTLRLYTRGAAELLASLGEDVGLWEPRAVRDFLIKRAEQGRSESTQKLITSSRAFLRYLSFRGIARDDLDLAIPAVAHWRLAKLPPSLSADELQRLLAACEGDRPGRLRDKAVLLLLSRLGLRAGDLVSLRLDDIDWEGGTLQVVGKGRYQVRLPMPQDVGDALLRYIKLGRRGQAENNSVFVRTIAPQQPLTAHGVSAIVKHALRRAGIQTPARGAHLLRHTAATEMLRNHVPLDQIGLVLRHRSIDMSAYYAKVDIGLLQQVAQPWPEVNA